MLTFKQFLARMRRPSARSDLQSIRYEAITQPLYTNQEIPMSPVFRVATDSSTAIAEIKDGQSLAEVLLAVRRGHADAIKSAKRAHVDALLALRRSFKSNLKQAKSSYLKRHSAKAIKELESKRKERVKSARRQAEYDIYKGLMSKLAIEGVPMKEAHKRAVEFAEHIIKHSPAGHEDVGYVD